MSSEMHGMFPTAMEFLGYQSKNSLADNTTDTDIATANLGSWRGFGAAADEQRSNSGCWPPSGIAVSGLSSIPSSHNFQSLAAASRKEFHGGRSAENRKLGVSMDMAEIIQQGSDGSNKQQHEQAYLVNTSGSSNNSRYHHQQQHGYSFFDASSSTTAANVLAAAHHSALGLNLPSLEHHHHQQQQQLLPFSIPVSSSTRWQQSNQADLGVVSNLSSVYPQHYSNGMAAVNNWLSSSTTTRGPLDASASAAAAAAGSSSQRLALSLSSSSSYSYRPPHPPEVQMISPGGGGGGNLFQMGGESSRSVTASGRNSDGPVFMGLDALTAAVSHQPSRESAAAAAIIRGEGAARSLFSGYGNCLRNSIYFKPAQELLLEFCNVGCCGEAKLDKDTASNKKKATVLDYSAAAAASGKTDEEFKSKKGGFNDDTHGLFAGDTYELQKRKAKLLSMLEEVDTRYKHYCSQLQMVVAAMEAVTAPGCAKPYTRLAVKAMSRHFRCLRDAITGQLQATAQLLGENQVTLHGNATRGETPRLGLIERALRQHQHHHNNQNSPRLLDPHPWRPQRGLPERSVSILRSWLFEHFLHPYPTDGDKHILAKQTGLTRSQVSNWFINARVRLWKPMVEEMYMEELNEEKMEKEEVKDDAAGAEAAETDAEKNPATTMNQATATEAADTVSYLQQQRFPSGNGGSSSFKVIAPAPTEMADSETTTSSSRREMATTPTTTQTQTQIQITMDEGPHPYKRLLQQQQQQLGPATAQTPGLQSACNVQDFVAYPAENLNLRYSGNNSTRKSSGAADNLGSNQNINNGVSLTLGLRHSGLPYHLSEPTAKYSAAAAATGSGIYMAPRTTTATAAANSTQHHDAHILEDSTAKNNGSGGGLIHQNLQQQYRHYTNGPRLLHDFVQG